MMLYRVFAAIILTLCWRALPAQEMSEQLVHEQPQSTSDVSSAIADVLAKHGTVARAYLLREPNSEQIVLALVFVKKYDAETVSEVMATFKRMAPNLPPLNIYLPTRSTWKRELGGIDPIYVHP